MEEICSVFLKGASGEIIYRGQTMMKHRARTKFSVDVESLVIMEGEKINRWGGTGGSHSRGQGDERKAITFDLEPERMTEEW